MSQTLKSPDIVAATNADALRGIIDEKMRDLPTLPVVVAKILQTAASPNSTAKDLQALIAVDAGLTAKVLRLANSSFYGQSRKITTLADAVVVLGFNAVRNLTLSASMLDSLAPRGAAQVFDWRAFWEHCNAVAACARQLARRQKLPAAAQEEAFIAGLLHDIGKLFLGKYCPDLLAEIVLTAETYQIAQADAEWYLMGTNHAMLGQHIAERWNFPSSLAGAIGAHHDPESWRDEPTMTYIIHAADVFTQWAGIGAVSSAKPRLNRSVDEYFGMTSVERDDLMEQIAAEMQKTRELLGWDETDNSAAPAPVLHAAAHNPDGTANPEILEVEEFIHATAVTIASANTIAEIRQRLGEAIQSTIPVWGSTLFLWSDESVRFIAAPNENKVDLLSRIGEHQMRESLLDKALSPTAGTARPAPVPAPRGLGALGEGHRFFVCGLRNNQKTIGFLLLGQQAQSAVPTAEQMDILSTLAAYGASGIARLQAFRASVEALATAIDARETNGGGGHSRRVRDLCLNCARQIGLSETRIEVLEVAALLHDVGKISIPERILSKTGALDAEEFENVASHAASGAHLAGHSFGAVMPYILCHHERWDGSGYPAGLSGNQIPMEAQIIAVAEAWDAMRTGHSYRPARSFDEARQEIEGGSGTQFNPAVVEAFLTALRSEQR